MDTNPRRLYFLGHNLRTGDYIITYTGKKFWPLDPQVEDIDILDISWALSRICRFGGHSLVHYPVAAHCIAVSKLVPEADALWGLLHDASEAYVGDMVSPLKRSMPEFQAAEKLVLEKIAKRFGLPPTIPASVEYVDKAIIPVEKRLYTAAEVDILPPDGNEYTAQLKAVMSTPLVPTQRDFVNAYIRRFVELTRS